MSLFSGRPDGHVRMCWVERGKRLGPLDGPMGEEVTSVVDSHYENADPGSTSLKNTHLDPSFGNAVSYSNMLKI